jgi:hypothetical protein
MNMTSILTHCENRKILNALDYQHIPEGIAGTTKIGNLPNLTFRSHGEVPRAKLSDRIKSIPARKPLVSRACSSHLLK